MEASFKKTRRKRSKNRRAWRKKRAAERSSTTELPSTGTETHASPMPLDKRSPDTQQKKMQSSATAVSQGDVKIADKQEKNKKMKMSDPLLVHAPKKARRHLSFESDFEDSGSGIVFNNLRKLLENPIKREPDLGSKGNILQDSTAGNIGQQSATGPEPDEVL